MIRCMQLSLGLQFQVCRYFHLFSFSTSSFYLPPVRASLFFKPLGMVVFAISFFVPASPSGFRNWQLQCLLLGHHFYYSHTGFPHCTKCQTNQIATSCLSITSDPSTDCLGLCPCPLLHSTHPEGSVGSRAAILSTSLS